MTNRKAILRLKTADLLGPYLGVRWKSGYVWRAETVGDGSEYRILGPRDRSVGYETVRPMDDPALFKNFADLEVGESAIRAFADEHGFLVTVPDLRPEVHPAAPEQGETFDVWASEIMKMHVTLVIADCLSGEEPNTEELQAWVAVWETIASIDLGLPGPSEHLVIELPGSPASLPREQRLVDAASRFLLMMVNNRLQENTRTGIVPGSGADASRRVSLEMVPKTLLGALWLQAAQALSEGRKFRECLECGRWFAVSTDKRRADSVYCSDSCKMKAYRKRVARRREDLRTLAGVDVGTSLEPGEVSELSAEQIAELTNADIDEVRAGLALRDSGGGGWVQDLLRQAREMREQGMAPSVIGRKLGVDTNVVRGWLGMSRLKR